jgi:hypothetical protein
MSFQATAAAATADVHTFDAFLPAAIKPSLPANDPADPENGWATRNPERAMLFLFVSPRDCGAVDELIAL